LSTIGRIFAIIYLTGAVFLAVYGLNALILTVLYLRHRRKTIPCPSLTGYPQVTVQLPIYNELHVVERLIDAVAALDYPRDRLQIQVLDDSTDETTRVAQARVLYHRRRGVDIELIHREQRVGFKAGALREGLAQARGELIVIFDADFVPPCDFLQRTVPYFLAHPRLGMVQTRWGHLNAEHSLLTRAQAIALDGHFVVEQTARNRSGLFMNFNGTAGVWRRECIIAAGGWSADTLSEDLDLSYRAQLAGWEFLYLPEVAAPAEIPPQIEAFKRQQFRWAKGSLQVLRKLWRPLLQARQPWPIRFQGLLHISSYLAHPLMLVLLLCIPVLMLTHQSLYWPLTYLSLASLGPPLLYTVAQRALYRDWPRRMLAFPLLALLGTGVAWNNTKAIIEALLRRESAFQRTPKFRVEGRTARWQESRYWLPAGRQVIGEVLWALYALVAAGVALRQGNLYTLPFLGLYIGGFGYVALGSLWQSREQRRGRRRGRRGLARSQARLSSWLRPLLGQKPSPVSPHETSRKI